MRVVKTVADIALAVAQAKIRGSKVAFVPTMGAIHKGHLSLVELARESAGFVIASIFVNPLQFNSEDDFKKYPRTEAIDSKLLEKAGVDVLFLPGVEEIYPDGKMQPTESAGEVGKTFEGASRPGHFDGMLTVVSRLFDIVQPDIAVFGEKDAQQLFLIRQMVARQLKEGKREPIEIRAGKTIRDDRGLALSSRNKRLSPSDLKAALSLSKALSEAQHASSKGAGTAGAYFAASSLFGPSSPAKLDYLALVNPETFQPIEEGFTGEALMIVAAEVGGIRLIDNRLITF